MFSLGIRWMKVICSVCCKRLKLSEEEPACKPTCCPVMTSSGEYEFWVWARDLGAEVHSIAETTYHLSPWENTSGRDLLSTWSPKGHQWTSSLQQESPILLLHELRPGFSCSFFSPKQLPCRHPGWSWPLPSLPQEKGGTHTPFGLSCGVNDAPLAFTDVFGVSEVPCIMYTHACNWQDWMNYDIVCLWNAGGKLLQ